MSYICHGSLVKIKKKKKYTYDLSAKRCSFKKPIVVEHLNRRVISRAQIFPQTVG